MTFTNVIKRVLMITHKYFFDKNQMLLHIALHVGIYSIYFFFPLDLIEYNIIFAVLSRVCAAGSYYACLQFASEIFPTEIRGKGSSAFEISGGIGLFIQPQINYLVSILQKT